ncbi:hypothetical protein BTA51_27350 [Hahella sp. CCB-MM4]|nr:hypothetical protein BTA51_27350 [Hahella sp. CCB-MM4]
MHYADTLIRAVGFRNVTTVFMVRVAAVFMVGVAAIFFFKRTVEGLLDDACPCINGCADQAWSQQNKTLAGRQG